MAHIQCLLFFLIYELLPLLRDSATGNILALLSLLIAIRSSKKPTSVTQHGSLQLLKTRKGKRRRGRNY